MKDIYLVSMVRVSIPDNASERLEKVLAYMSQHCADATLVSVAAHFNFHPNTVSGMIKRETGKSFGDTLREIRMQRALGLLEARTLSIAQIAQLCGYENPSNFYRVFKDSFGMTPRAYMARRDANQRVFAEGEEPVPARYVEVEEDLSDDDLAEGEILSAPPDADEGAEVLGMAAPSVKVPASAIRGSVTVRSGERDADDGRAGTRQRAE